MPTTATTTTNASAKPARSPLQLAYDAANAKREDLESARARDRRERLAEYTAVLDRDLDITYKEAIKQAREEEICAHAALMQEREREALTRQYPYPLGTVMVEWNSRYYSRHDPTFRRLTGKRGVLEIITAASEHPANKSYGLAGIGELVVRVLKKDGTSGRSYVTGWKMHNQWVPEGTDLMQADLSWPEAGAKEETTEGSGPAKEVGS